MEKEEAIEVVKKNYPHVNESGSQFETALRTLIPELAESGDEKIRNFLIDFIKVCSWTEKKDQGWPLREECIAWLEKQGEQKPKFRVGDTIKCKYDDRQFTIKSVDLDKGTYTYTQEGCGNDIDYADEEFELVEQNPADKVEPKFNVGDKIIGTLSNCLYYITEVCDGYYLTDVGCVIMFNAQDNFELSNQKPAWSEEDEKNINLLCELLTELQVKSTENEIKYGTNNLSKYYHDTKEWLKSLKNRVQPKQEWSEEDDYVIERLFCLLDNEQDNYPQLSSDFQEIEEIKNKLKSLKDRVQLKQEWSEEDDFMVENVKNSFGLHCGQMTNTLKEQYDKFFNKVKSLRLQNWKPSDEQMDALRQVISGCSYDIEPLVEMEEQLKKLMEE